ncbi:LegC family aminotransferase [Pedobacter fastidiosus]|uniref:LegC family aminotransferase n=1 Tax=Pedobacter fastidiosus TaxID=2765361 RepID=A0ABR7KR43_9SPHI|nr:LegC family aminotransferase [Pedobacter fastidiosus]MBC6110562.1 LegC family aminotransferase [Pedobacter fastidiosus]
MEKFQKVVDFIKEQYPDKDFVSLHEPVFIGNERKYVLDAIDSTFVSSVGAYVNRFEEMMAELTGAKYAIAIVNGTNALHLALLLANVKAEDEVISQALTFIATANAISYIGAKAIFIDVDRETLGMSPTALRNFLEANAIKKEDGAYNKKTGKKIAAVVPMHTFGFPCKVDEIAIICDEWNICLVEDSAESIGSYYQGKHTGVFGKVGVFSFNGNKTVTCGGGGALITDDETIAKRAKHLTTQAKVPHKWEFVHDHIGYNYRMPNLNAALACAQLEQLSMFVENKRVLSAKYNTLFNELSISFIGEPVNAKANYWLNAILLADLDQRNEFLEYTNDKGVMTRPVWELMNRLPMFANCQTDDLKNSIWIADRLVNIPSGYRVK